jgi:LysW-gamma-L-alpha-aminoadipyl-6-phosphate/LysW-L-glutamyl-5-phosphate reductase
MTTRVAVIGATGYGGAELLRHLLWHPAVTVTKLVAKDHVGARIDAVLLSLTGMTDLVVEDLPPEEVVKDADLVFLGLPHRVSGELACRYAELGAKVVDLSGDMRLLDADAYAKFYGVAHPLPEQLGTFVYGMPELNRAQLRDAQRVASPGCFATAITLALLPWARAGLLSGRVRVCAMTGSSGSGARPSATTHHPARAGTLRPYRPLNHQHTPEIVQSLRLAGGEGFALDFVPVSAPLVRGILTTSFLDVPAEMTKAEISDTVRTCFDEDPFVRVLEGRLPEVGAIAGSMYCDVGVSVGDEIRDGLRPIVMHSALDNLVKGGAGQAVQSMNLMIGLDEATGLQAPSLWP